MISFDLDRAHPWYRFVIRNQIWTLADKYPQASLKRVRIYRPASADDRSLGNADKNGVIALNEYWFAQPPEVLRHAAENWPLMPLGDGRFIEWHGPMTREPEHVLTHEYGHVVAQGNDAIAQWSDIYWNRITANPETAPTGYALSDIAECWAECFACCELGYGALVGEPLPL